MATVTISLRNGRTMAGKRVPVTPDIIDLERLSPRARALAEAVHATLGHKAGWVWIECDRPRGQGYRTAEERAAYGGGPLDDQPMREQWHAWDKYPADSPTDPHDYLEQQAGKIPAGWHIVGATYHDQVPTTDRELTADQVVATIARYQPGNRITARTWRSYVSRGRAPQPIRHIGRTPLWDPSQVLEWLQNRPGQGARTDLRADT